MTATETPASPETLRSPLPAAVLVPREEDDGLLAVALAGGVCELSSTVLLRGAARRLLERYGAELTLERAERDLCEAGASAEEAASDARAFLGSLRDHGLLPRDDASAGAPAPRVAEATSPESPAPSRAESQGDAVPLAARDLERVARVVLERGHQLRYRAFGGSMRPAIPSGSTLEVEARAFDDIRRGEVALYSVGETRLVAHRVVGRRGGKLLLRGDTCARLDEASAADVLGVVSARIDPDGRVVRVSSGARRLLGLVAGLVWRVAGVLVRTFVVRPLGASAFLRGALWRFLGFTSAALRRLERAGRRLRRPLDVARSALLSETEKDERRRSLYERESVQRFTALDENVEAGLTLIEELLLARHPIPAGPEGSGGSGVLVLGCGPGRECMVLAERGLRVTGVDREEGMLAEARRLAAARDLDVRYVTGEATDAAAETPVADERFDAVVVFSGLYNMVLPSARRIALLAAARERLTPGGRVLLTFLSAYVPPCAERAPTSSWTGLLRAIRPDHEEGDLYLRNEAVHVFPRGEDVAAEAHDAGLEVVALHRDQRAYDRAEGRVRGYAVLRRPEVDARDEAGAVRA